MCAYYKVPCILFGDKEQLGRAIGREYRSSLAVCEAHIAKNKHKESDITAWSARSIQCVLDNPVYAGKIAYGRRIKEKQDDSWLFENSRSR